MPQGRGGEELFSGEGIGLGWNQRQGEGIKSELAIEIATNTGGQLIHFGDGPSNPLRVDGMRESLQFFR